MSTMIDGSAAAAWFRVKSPAALRAAARLTNQLCEQALPPGPPSPPASPSFPLFSFSFSPAPLSVSPRAGLSSSSQLDQRVSVCLAAEKTDFSASFGCFSRRPLAIFRAESVLSRGTSFVPPHAGYCESDPRLRYTDILCLQRVLFVCQQQLILYICFGSLHSLAQIWLHL